MRRKSVNHHLNATLGAMAVRTLDGLSLAVWGLVVRAGLTQNAQYNGSWLTSYGADVFGPIALWWGWRRTIFALPTYGAEMARQKRY